MDETQRHDLEIRAQVRFAYTGNRELDLRHYEGHDLAVAEDAWGREAASRYEAGTSKRRAQGRHDP